MSIKRAFLLALFAVHRRPIFNLRIGAPLALVPYKRCYNVAVLASRGLAVRFDVLLALFAYGARAPFRSLLKFRATVSALYHGKCSTTFLGKVKVKKKIVNVGTTQFERNIITLITCVEQQKNTELKYFRFASYRNAPNSKQKKIDLLCKAVDPMTTPRKGIWQNSENKQITGHSFRVCVLH